MSLSSDNAERAARLGLSPTVSITKRVRKTGNRYQVRFRYGFQMEEPKHAGSLKNRKLAKKRADFCMAELIHGRDPRETLSGKVEAKIDALTLPQLCSAYNASRVDVSPETRDAYEEKAAFMCAALGRAANDPAALTVERLQLLVGDATLPEGEPKTAGKLKPATLKQYVGYIASVLDYGRIEPNVARDKRLKLPKVGKAKRRPPSSGEFDTLLTYALTKYPEDMDAIELMEACGLRISEALLTQKGDLNIAEQSLLVRKSKTQAGTRFVPVPDRIFDALVSRSQGLGREGELFAGTNDQHLRYVLRKSARKAGIAHVHPHLLRHRRISLWIKHGIDPVQVKTWSGHTKAEMSVNVYGHEIEAESDRWRDFWKATYRGTRVLA